MRGLTAQFIAPLSTALVAVVAGMLAGYPALGVFAGAVSGSMVAWLLGRSARRRLSALESMVRQEQAADWSSVARADIHDEVDRLVRAVAQFAVNVERRQALDLQLLEQQALVLDRMNDGLMRVSADGRVAYANVAAGTLFGGRNPMGRSFVSVTRDHELSEAVLRCLEAGEDQQHTFEIAGEGRVISAIMTPLLTRPPEVLVTLRDITEVNLLQNLRRDFVANVSHELRTPLSTMKILTETLLDIRGDDEEAASFLAKIDAEIDSMTALVRDLLDLSKLETPGVRLALRKIDPVMLVRDVCDRMRLLAERQGVSLSAEANSEAVDLVADERRLHQALINLVTNAIAHTPPGGSVSVSCGIEGEHVVFSVRDTGSGIVQEDLPRIWERFFKTDRARTGPGTGLGLAIVKHIAQAHGGSVTVSSTLGKGAEFRIAIPRNLTPSQRLPSSKQVMVAPP